MDSNTPSLNPTATIPILLMKIAGVMMMTIAPMERKLALRMRVSPNQGRPTGTDLPEASTDSAVAHQLPGASMDSAAMHPMK